jgi:hypothetical protein
LSPFWLDANVFVEAKNRYYKFERVPKFWSFLSAQIQVGSICSPKAVYDELMPYRDQLSAWVKTRKAKGLCVNPNDDIQSHFSRVANHVATKYPRHRSEEFLSGADPWVIAYSLHFGGTVVTQESTSRRKKVRIPTVCIEFDVRCIDTFEMLDWFKAKF